MDPDLVVNFDQSRLYFLPAGRHTYAPKGDKEVPGGVDSKAAFTLVVGSTMGSKLLLFQVGASAARHCAAFCREWWGVGWLGSTVQRVLCMVM